MGVFRKKPTLNEQMLRDAGLDRVVISTPQPQPEASSPVPGVLPGRGVGVGAPSGGDTTTTLLAPGIDADEVRFTVLPEGDLIVESECDSDLTALADAIEAHLSPPYTARGARQEGDLWGVAAWRIEVAEFACPNTESLQLSQRDGVSEFRVNDGPTDVAPPPELLQLGENKGPDFFASARRIDGDYWEVMVNRY